MISKSLYFSGPQYHLREKNYILKHTENQLVWVSHSVMTHQTPLSMGFSRQELLAWVASPFSRGFSQPRDQT